MTKTNSPLVAFFMRQRREVWVDINTRLRAMEEDVRITAEQLYGKLGYTRFLTGLCMILSECVTLAGDRPDLDALEVLSEVEHNPKLSRVGRKAFDKVERVIRKDVAENPETHGMTCPNCFGHVAVSMAEANVDRYDGAAVEVSTCCGVAFWVKRIRGFQYSVYTGSSDIDNWGEPINKDLQKIAFERQQAHKGKAG